MSYISLESYKKKWIFNHQAMPIELEDRELIKPMSESRSAQLWREYISKQSPTAEHFSSQDWPNLAKTWENEFEWQADWDADADLPEQLLAYLAWDEQAIVYFCYDKTDVIETNWKTFKKYWKNFLFYDDNPLLIAKKNKQVAQFYQSGRGKFGCRP